MTAGFTELRRPLTQDEAPRYDNEWGYSNRLVDLAQRVLAPVVAGS